MARRCRPPSSARAQRSSLRPEAATTSALQRNSPDALLLLVRRAGRSGRILAAARARAGRPERDRAPTGHALDASGQAARHLRLAGGLRQAALGLGPRRTARSCACSPARATSAASRSSAPTSATASVSARTAPGCSSSPATERGSACAERLRRGGVGTSRKPRIAVAREPAGRVAAPSRQRCGEPTPAEPVGTCGRAPSPPPSAPDARARAQRRCRGGRLRGDEATEPGLGVPGPWPMAAAGAHSTRPPHAGSPSGSKAVLGASGRAGGSRSRRMGETAAAGELLSGERARSARRAPRSRRAGRPGLGS